jgi:hypothetical protein
MRRSLSYADAVKMLGGGEIPLVKVLDRFSALGLLAVPGIDLVAVCRELVRAGDELLTRFSERSRGMDRLTRTERLRAAHAVIVLTAYFETLQAAFDGLPAGYSVRITTAQQVSLAGGPADAGLRGIAGALLNVVPVQPAPAQSNEVMLERLEAFYADLSGHVVAFAADLAAWDALGEAECALLTARLRGSVPSLAVGKYEELFRRLSGECPEFGIWADMLEHQATRAELRNGLAGLEDLLASVACERVPGQRIAALARAYRGALAKPIVPSGEVPEGLQIPTLGEGYVDHRIRVAEVGASSEPGRDSWWGDVPARDDACRFLAGYLTSPAAQEAPLMLLGQPGSGKSILTRILAARLPATDFLPVRVELRQVPAEADLQDQIEFAVRMATGERMSWPRLVESGDGALPVVILDGFDELLQATGVAQTDFLLKVLAFQEREADQGRPLAVIVTSRTAVTDRARIPDGAVAVRLEPFDEDQVTAWLEIWRRANAALLAGRGLRSLPPATALKYRELAEQPLLLLMLALYDADANALQSRSAELGRTELYGRLLKEFARREIRKHSAGLPPADLEIAVEKELLRLSVVAFAMFNRRSQWVAEADLDDDISILLGSRERQPPGLRAPLTAAQLAVGRFFFVHESHATRDETRLQTYEFLHATFGEFLVARLVTQILTDMTAREAAAAGSPLGGADDGLLHALLSFAALTARAPIVAFLDDLLAGLDPRQRQVLSALLLRLHSQALYQRTESAFNHYQPLALPVTARHAAWSANLVVLAVLSAGQVTGSQLFPQEPDPAIPWRDQAMMWRSQLTSEEWYGLCATIALERAWDGDRREVRLWRDDGTFDPPYPDIHWTYNIPPGHPSRKGIFVWQGHSPENLRRKGNFTAGKSDDFMSYGLRPFAAASPTAANVFVNLDSGPVSAGQVMTAALLALYENNAHARPIYADLATVTRELAHPSHAEHDYHGYVKIALAILASAVEQGAAPADLLSPFLDTANLNREDARLAELLSRIRKLLLTPQPDISPP